MGCKCDERILLKLTIGAKLYLELQSLVRDSQKSNVIFFRKVVKFRMKDNFKEVFIALGLVLFQYIELSQSDHKSRHILCLH